MGAAKGSRGKRNCESSDKHKRSPQAARRGKTASPSLPTCSGKAADSQLPLGSDNMMPATRRSTRSRHSVSARELLGLKPHRPSQAQPDTETSQDEVEFGESETKPVTGADTKALVKEEQESSSGSAGVQQASHSDVPQSVSRGKQGIGGVKKKLILIPVAGKEQGAGRKRRKSICTVQEQPASKRAAVTNASRKSITSEDIVSSTVMKDSVDMPVAQTTEALPVDGKLTESTVGSFKIDYLPLPSVSDCSIASDSIAGNDSAALTETPTSELNPVSLAQSARSTDKSSQQCDEPPSVNTPVTPPSESTGFEHLGKVHTPVTAQSGSMDLPHLGEVEGTMPVILETDQNSEMLTETDLPFGTLVKLAELARQQRHLGQIKTPGCTIYQIESQPGTVKYCRLDCLPDGSVVVRQVKPCLLDEGTQGGSKKKPDEEQSHKGPLTSDDLQTFPTTKKGRAQPQRHIILEKELQKAMNGVKASDDMDNHLIITYNEHGRRIKVGQCKYCTEMIQTRHQFRKHMRTHPEVDYKPYACPICGYRSDIKAGVARHINIHSKTKPYVCTECGRGFNYKQKLELHMKYHYGKRDQPCPLCDMAFHEWKTLRKHMQSIHDEAAENIERYKLNRRSRTAVADADELQDVDTEDEVTNQPEFIEGEDMENGEEEKEEENSDMGNNGEENQEKNMDNGREETQEKNVENRREENKEQSMDNRKEEIKEERSPQLNSEKSLENETIEMKLGQEEQEVIDNSDVNESKETVLVDKAAAEIADEIQLRVEPRAVSCGAPEVQEVKILDTTDANARQQSLRFIHLMRNATAGIQRRRYTCLKTELQTRRYRQGYSRLGASHSEIHRTTPWKKNRGQSAATSQSTYREDDGQDTDTDTPNETTGDVTAASDDIKRESDEGEGDSAEVTKELDEKGGGKESEEENEAEENYERKKLKVTVDSRLKKECYENISCTDGQPGLQCKLCEAELFTKTALYAHLEREHRDQRLWQCPEPHCDYNCRLRSSLSAHSRIHLGKRDYQCDECARTFYTQQKLNVHKRTHTDIMPHQCSLCDRKFRESADMKKHIMRVHEEARPHVCKTCDKAFSDTTQLIRHQETHVVGKPLKCPYCEKWYKSSSSLSQHIKSHSCMFHCEICDKNFGSYSGFMAHKVMHDESFEGFRCTLCSKVLHTKGSWKRHINVSHSGDRPFSCKKCFKAFKSKKDLKNHYMVHGTGQYFICSVCQFRCHRLDSLRVHMRRHQDVKPFVCNVCGKEYTQKAALETHLRHYTGNMAGECTLCHKTFATKYQLERHMYGRHNGCKGKQERKVTVFVCEECNSVFISQDALAVHILAEHMNKGFVSGRKEKIQPGNGKSEEGGGGEGGMADMSQEQSTGTRGQGLNTADGIDKLDGIPNTGDKTVKPDVETFVTVTDPATNTVKIVSILAPKQPDPNIVGDVVDESSVLARSSVDHFALLSPAITATAEEIEVATEVTLEDFHPSTLDLESVPVKLESDPQQTVSLRELLDPHSLDLPPPNPELDPSLAGSSGQAGSQEESYILSGVGGGGTGLEGLQLEGREGILLSEGTEGEPSQYLNQPQPPESTHLLSN